MTRLKIIRTALLETEQWANMYSSWMYLKNVQMVLKVVKILWVSLCWWAGESWVGGKLVPVHAMKAYRESRGIAPLIHHLGPLWRWMIRFIHQPLHSRCQNPQYPFNRSVGESQSWSGHLQRRESYFSPVRSQTLDSCCQVLGIDERTVVNVQHSN